MSFRLTQAYPRLWSLDAAECDFVLNRMVAARVLRETRDGYVAGRIRAA